MNSRKKLVAVWLMAWAHAAQADGQIVDVQSRASVAGVCHITAVREVNFGVLDPSNAQDTFAEGGVGFACTRGMNYRASIGLGQYYDTATGLRRLRMDLGNDYIPYRLNTEGLNGMGNGFNQGQEIMVRVTIRGADYRDTAAGAYRDVIHFTFEP